MKKAVVVITVLFWAVIIFFTVMGETMFYEWCPQVTMASSVYTRLEDGTEAKLIPKTGLFEGKYVYTVNRMPGFSAEICTLERHEVTVEEYNDDFYVATSDMSGISRIIGLCENGDPEDGVRVNVKEGSVGFDAYW